MENKKELWQRLKDRVQQVLPQPTAQDGTGKVVEGEADLPVDTRRPMRLGYRVLGYGLGGFLLWAVLAPLDEGVPAHATVMLDTKRKEVAHQHGGIVSHVLVREGQMVKEGDVLLRLNEAVSRAQYETIRQGYMSLRAMESRLLAELQKSEEITFHTDLLAAQEDPFVKQHMDNQRNLLQARRMAIQAELGAIEEAMAGQRALERSYAEMLPHRKNQIALLREELAGIRDLVAEGYAPRVRQFEMERQLAELNANTAELQGNLSRTSRSILEMRQRLTHRQQEYYKEVEGQLAEVRREVDANAEKLKAATEDLQRTEIRSPATGQVVGLSVQTVGGVIQPSEKLMDIVPENESLLLEIHVPTHLIDRIKANELVDIRFNAFAHSPQLVVEGKLVSVSNDAIIDPNNQVPPYYLARAAVTPDGMKRLGKRTMQPGMPAEVVIKTGSRSLLTYLLHPLVKRVAASLTEE